MVGTTKKTFKISELTVVTVYEKHNLIQYKQNGRLVIHRNTNRLFYTILILPFI